MDDYEIEGKTWVKPDTNSDSGFDSKPDTALDTASNAVPDTDPDSEPDAISYTETDAMSDTEPDAVTDTEPDTMSDTETDAVPDTESLKDNENMVCLDSIKIKQVELPKYILNLLTKLTENQKQQIKNYLTIN